MKKKALHSAVHSSSIQTVLYKQQKLTQTVSAVMQVHSSAKLKLLNMSATIQVKFAQLSGRKVLKHLSQAYILSEKFKEDSGHHDRRKTKSTASTIFTNDGGRRRIKNECGI